MDNNVNLALFYIRDGKETIFPVKDIDQAVRLADAIANSDCLNDSIDYSLIDVCEYHNGEVGDAWESEDGMDFNEYWKLCQDDA